MNFKYNDSVRYAFPFPMKGRDFVEGRVMSIGSHVIIEGIDKKDDRNFCMSVALKNINCIKKLDYEVPAAKDFVPVANTIIYFKNDKITNPTGKRKSFSFKEKIKKINNNLSHRKGLDKKKVQALINLRNKMKGFN